MMKKYRNVIAMWVLLLLVVLGGCATKNVETETSAVQSASAAEGNGFVETEASVLPDDGATAVSECVETEPASRRAEIAPGIIWEYYEGSRLLIISGEGAMPDYDTWKLVPWHELQIETAEIEEGITEIGRMSFANMSSLKTVLIPESVTSINAYAFSESMDLKGISISENVRYIGDWAFVGTEISSIELSNELTYIGSYAFYGAEIKRIEIPGTISTIGEGAFMHSSLKEIVLTASINEIKIWAFYGCDELADVYFCGTEEQWNAIKMGNENDDLWEANMHFNYG